MVSLETDPVLASLLVLLGAAIYYLIDELFHVTPRLTSWIDKVFGANN
jgi:hypothetical protein